MLFRINDTLALKQASIFVAGAALLALTILFLRDYHVARALPLPDRHRPGSCCCWRRGSRASAAQVNGAYLQINLGPLSFQPAEVAKICIVIFLASYLHEKRELLDGGGPTGRGADDPAAQALRPAARRLGRGDAACSSSSATSAAR